MLTPVSDRGRNYEKLFQCGWFPPRQLRLKQLLVKTTHTGRHNHVPESGQNKKYRQQQVLANTQSTSAPRAGVEDGLAAPRTRKHTGCPVAQVAERPTLDFGTSQAIRVARSRPVRGPVLSVAPA